LILGGAAVLGFYAMTKMGQDALITGGRKTGEATAKGIIDGLKEGLNNILPDFDLPPSGVIVASSPVLTAGADIAGIMKLINSGVITPKQAKAEYYKIMHADGVVSPAEKTIYGQIARLSTPISSTDRANLSRMGINATGGYTPQVQASLAAYPAWEAARQAQRAAEQIVKDVQTGLKAPVVQQSFATGVISGLPGLPFGPSASQAISTTGSELIEYGTPAWNELSSIIGRAVDSYPSQVYNKPIVETPWGSLPSLSDLFSR